MFVRMTSIKFTPETTKEAKRIFMQEVVPVVRKQKGNVTIRLLEPTEPSDEFISLTEWETKADADAYESSGKYKELVGLLKGYFTQAPILKTFRVEEALVTTD